MSVYYEKILACIICKKIEAVIMLVIYIKERDCIRFALIKATRQPDALSEGCCTVHKFRNTYSICRDESIYCHNITVIVNRNRFLHQQSHLLILELVFVNASPKL